MSTMTPEERSLLSSIAANERWADCPDRSAATRPGRERFLAKFEDEVDPDRVLPVAERARRAALKRRAHMQRLALKSARARRKSREQSAEAAAADADLAAMGGDVHGAA